MVLKPERKHRCVYEAQAKITLSSSGPKKQIHKDLLVDFLQSCHTKANREQSMPHGCCFFLLLLPISGFAIGGQVWIKIV